MKAPPASSLLVIVLGLLATVTSALGQGTTPISGLPPISLVPPPRDTPSLPPPPQNETTLTLDVGFGIRPVPPARATVPAGDKLRLVAPRLGENLNYIWTKNGRAIAGAPDSNILILGYVTTDDVGTYACLFSTPTTLPQTSQSVILGVGPTNRLLNLSTRTTVAPEQPLTTGFVVSGTASKKLILRAIGPSLAAFGVANPLRAPVLRIYDSSGKLYENSFAYLTVVGAPTYESDLADSLAKTGAFLLPAGTRDVTEMRPFDPGSYTATVTTGDGTTGTVLLEIYEVP